MFVAPVSLIPNPGAGNESKHNNVGSPRPSTAVTLNMQLMSQPPAQITPTTSAGSQSSTSAKTPRRFCLYFIFENIRKESKWKFMKFALRIRSSTCTVSQQKSAWAYLLHYVASVKDNSDLPYGAMGDRMRTIYFERFNCTLLANPNFPLLTSLAVLDSATPIQGFDIPDPFHGVFSIIEHFKMNLIGGPTFKESAGVPFVLPSQGLNTRTPSSLESVSLLAGPPGSVAQVQVAQQYLTSSSFSPSASTSTSIQREPVTKPWNFVHYNPPDHDVLSISSTSTCASQEENTINLDDYKDSPDNAVKVEEVTKAPMVISPLSLNVLPIQGILQYHNGQLLTTGGLPVLQLKGLNNAIGQLGNNVNKDVILSHIPAVKQASGGKIPIPALHAPPPAKKQKKPRQTGTTVASMLKNKTAESREKISSMQSGSGQVPSTVCLSTKETLNMRISKRRKKAQSNLGPTLKKDELDQRESSTQQKALYVQGTNEVIILEDETKSESSAKSSSSNFSGRMSPYVEPKQPSVVDAKVQLKAGMKAHPKHLSLFDSSILRGTSGKNVKVQLAPTPSPPPPQPPHPRESQHVTYVALTDSPSDIVDLSTCKLTKIEQDSSKLTKKEQDSSKLTKKEQDSSKLTKKEQDSSELTKKEQDSSKLTKKEQDSSKLTMKKPDPNKLTKKEQDSNELAKKEDTKESFKAAPRSSKIKDLVGVSADAIADQTAGQQKIKDLINVGADFSNQGAGQNKIKDLIGLNKATAADETASQQSSNDTVAVWDHTVKAESSISVSSAIPYYTVITQTLSDSMSNTPPRPVTVFKHATNETDKKLVGGKRPASDDSEAPKEKAIKLEDQACNPVANRTVINSPVKHVKNSLVKHVPSILGARKTAQGIVKLESDEGSKRMTGSNRWKFSKQRVHVSKREMIIESPAQHDLRIQPEPMPRRKGNRRKPKREERTIVLISDGESDQEELKVKPKPKEAEEKPRTKVKLTVKELIEQANVQKVGGNSQEIVRKTTQQEEKLKVKPTDVKPKQETPEKPAPKDSEPLKAQCKESAGKKVYMWVPMKRRFGIMSRSTVDKDGNKVYKSKVKTSKFFSISKKRMKDLGLKGNEGRPLTPNSELQNRLKALCKTMKVSDLVDRSCEQASFLSAFGLISTVKLETACSEITQGRTSRRRQIKAPSRYDL